MTNFLFNSSLDAALSVWAEQQNLAPLRAAAMREQILALEPVSSKPLPPEWWLGFSAKLNESLHQSLLPVASTSKLILHIPYGFQPRAFWRRA
jgi:hypothetical protein